ncbi:hypothetical protein FISHEDRAFT_59562 [Fistulina hepatica ATCC 64428]|uniref:Pal1-domain-containing protein n=1 Tax=Fistulina hepatica ATCC 64428 TaxID=1128425 RepID=A0A0D7AB00_9AGAR|nr:hypothetical protein FISHEDRAFT_59562 [Fistulina hepatica ATCC 64428]
MPSKRFDPASDRATLEQAIQMAQFFGGGSRDYNAREIMQHDSSGGHFLAHRAEDGQLYRDEAERIEAESLLHNDAMHGRRRQSHDWVSFGGRRGSASTTGSNDDIGPQVQEFPTATGITFHVRSRDMIHRTPVPMPRGRDRPRGVPVTLSPSYKPTVYVDSDVARRDFFNASPFTPKPVQYAPSHVYSAPATPHMYHAAVPVMPAPPRRGSVPNVPSSMPSKEHKRSTMSIKAVFGGRKH